MGAEKVREVGNDHLFPGPGLRKPLSGMAMTMLLRRMKVEEVTVHGFRSAFRDWVGEETFYRPDLAEAALAKWWAMRPCKRTEVAMPSKLAAS